MGSGRRSSGADWPARVVVVVGTSTDVGKTWVTARLLRVLRAQGVTVAARKLAQSHAPEDDPETFDAAVLGAAGGERPDAVCPLHRWYPAPMAPPMAAQALGRPGFTIADLLGELRWPERAEPLDVGLVETAGGLRSPQADDGDARSVVSLLDPAGTIVVADAGLGAINAVLLTTDALVAAAPEGTGPPICVVLNRFDVEADLHRRTRHWLEARAGLLVATMPGEEASVARWILGPHTLARPGDV